jgi:hypothetical protein
MILCNINMQKAMEDGRLVIDPKPLPLRPTGGLKCPYDTHSVNLRLGSELSIPLAGPFSFDLMQGGNLSTFLSRNSDKITIPPSGLVVEHSLSIGRKKDYL